MKADPKLSRAGALRNAMLAYMNDEGSPLTRPRHYGAIFHHRRGGREMRGGAVAPRVHDRAIDPHDIEAQDVC